GIVSSSPGLRGTSYPGSAAAKHSQPQRGCAAVRRFLIPHVTFVPFDLVFSEQRPQFILKARFLMMLLLLFDIPNDLGQIGLTYREIRITALPLKIQIFATLFL